jgi:hypothetical protein
MLTSVVHFWWHNLLQYSVVEKEIPLKCSAKCSHPYCLLCEADFVEVSATVGTATAKSGLHAYHYAVPLRP